MSGPKKKDDDAIVYLLLSVKLIALFARESPQTLFTRKRESGSTLHNFSNKEIPGTHSVHC